MHELSVTQNLLDLALRHAERAGAVHINELNIVIGELASIVDDSVQFYWDMISAGTIAHGAKLNFRRVSASLHCNPCGHDFPMDRHVFICPACGSEQIIVTGGEEFYLESIDVDLAPQATAQN